MTSDRQENSNKQKEKVMKKKIRISHRVTLYIDHSDEHTPAMVESKGNWSSYDCALDTGEIDGEVFLTNSETATLEKYRDAVDEAFEIARKDNPEYN